MKMNLYLMLLLSFGVQNRAFSEPATAQQAFYDSQRAAQTTAAADASTGKWARTKAAASTFASGFWYAMSAAAVAQSLLNLKSSKKSGKGVGHVDDFGNPFANQNNSGGLGNGSDGNNENGLDSFTVDNPPTDAEFLAALSPDVRAEFGEDIANPYALAKELKEKGYEFDEKTGGVKTPDGFVSADQLNAEGKKLAGTKEFLDYQKKLEQKKRNVLRVQRLQGGTNDGYAGRGSGATKKQETQGFNFNSGGDRSPASAEPVEKVSYINGEPVPSKDGNIFRTMTEAYQDLLSNKTLKNSTK